MLAESHFLIRRTLRFIALPYCYTKLVNWDECTSSKVQVLRDLLYIFFRLKYFPDNYTPCRFWEKNRDLWKYYYGSSYDPYQRQKLRKNVNKYEYITLFDDKEVCEILCRGIGVNIPEYYGVITPDSNYQQSIKTAMNSSGNMFVIIKPALGQGGKGIAMAHSDGNKIQINLGKKTIPLEKFTLKERSILQEVVIQNKEIANISSSSVNTVRIVTMLTKNNKALVISASMRFGVGSSFIDNWSAGGVAVGVDIDSGRLKEIAYDKIGRQYFEHPVSKVKFLNFKIPKWDHYLKLAFQTQQAFPFYKMLGLDIALTSTGEAILIEVNPNTDLVFQEQTSGPLFSDERTWQEFKNYGLFVNKYQKSLY